MWLLLACAPHPDGPHGHDSTQPGDSVPPDDTALSCVVEPGPPDQRIDGAEPRAAEVWSGSVTWTVDFDLLAEHEGFRDCTYTRTYAEMVEIIDEPWLCPECSIILKGAAVVAEGYDDCYTQISTSAQERVEQIGLGDVDGAPWFYRGGNENVRLTPLDVATVTSDAVQVAWSDPSAMAGTRTLTLSAAGGFTRRVADDMLVTDPQDPREEPYTCGWPTMNPGGPNTSWDVATGQVFPNFRMEDQCGEPFSSWDLLGRYVVIDASSPDCGPCQVMAEAAPAFEAAMEEACVPVETLTLLNEALGAVNRPAEKRVRRDWAETFGLDAPVVGDLGLGYAILAPWLGYDSGMSLPSWVVLAPDGRLLGGGTGFSADAGGFDEIQAMILADVAAHPGR